MHREDIGAAIRVGKRDSDRHLAAQRGVCRFELDHLDKIFSLLDHYRQLIVETDYLYGCPIGSLALEIHQPDATVRELLAAYFLAWTDAVHECLIEADRGLPDELDRLGLAEFVLTTMEGAAMQACTFRDIAYFDRAVQQLTNYIEILLHGRQALPFPVRQALAASADE